MPSKGTLTSRVEEELRRGMSSGQYPPGSKLPTETELASLYEVSRPTIRAALRSLAGNSLVRTQHGVGTFVIGQPAIRAGLERMDSITDSIRSTGREPGMVYQSRVVRPLLPDEAQKMSVSANSLALELRRSILADQDVVAYSYDLMPMTLFPADFDPEELNGSIFAFLRERLGIHPHHAVAEIHAVHSEHVAWGPGAGQQDLYVLLDQLHFADDSVLVLYSRTYFIEGRYSFTILRTL